MRTTVYDVELAQKVKGSWLKRYLLDTDEMAFGCALEQYRYLKAVYDNDDDVSYQLVRVTYEHDADEPFDCGEIVDKKIIYSHDNRE